MGSVSFPKRHSCAFPQKAKKLKLILKLACSILLTDGGRFRIGADGFVGRISGMNVWTVAMGRSDIAQRAVGCGIEGGDIVDWSKFSNENHLIYPPSCLDIGGNYFAC